MVPTRYGQSIDGSPHFIESRPVRGPTQQPPQSETAETTTQFPDSTRLHPFNYWGDDP